MRNHFFFATAIAASAILYLCLGLWDIENPGLQYDEVLFANASLGIKDHSFVAWTIPIGSKNVPVMLMPYLGALKAYLYFPILRLFDADPLAIRLPTLLVGAVSLLLYVLLVRRAVGWKGTLAFALLLATDPSYLYHTRLDWGPVALMLLLKAAGVLFFVKWWDNKGLLYLALSGFCLGLGVFDKVNFVWFILAASSAIMLVYRWELLTRANVASFVTFACSVVFGALPVIMYNLAFPLVTIREPFEPSGVSLISNVAHKTQTIVDTLSGVAVFKFVNLDDVETLCSCYVPLAPSDGGLLNSIIGSITGYPFGRGSLLFPALLIAVAFLLARLVHRPPHSMRLASVALLTSAFIVLQLFITNKATGSYHVMVLYPLPQFLIVLALIELASGGKGRVSDRERRFCFRAKAAYSIAVLILASNILVDVGYLRYFSAEGGKGAWSSAIYDLADYAEARPENRFVLMDWGFNTQLLILSKGGIRKDEVYHWLSDGQAERERFNAYLQDLSSLYVFHTPKYTRFAKPKELFAKFLEERRLKEEIIQTFYQKNGDAVYYVSRVAPSLYGRKQ